jgi:hypothetical protein
MMLTRRACFLAAFAPDSWLRIEKRAGVWRITRGPGSPALTATEAELHARRPGHPYLRPLRWDALAPADPDLAAYYFAEPSPWDPAYASRIRKLGPDNEDKQRYVEFLKDRFGYSITLFNETYQEQATAFSDLLHHAFPHLDPTRDAILQDDRRFLLASAELFYAETARRLRAADPHHLWMSHRLPGDLELAQVAAKHCPLVHTALTLDSPTYPRVLDRAKGDPAR